MKKESKADSRLEISSLRLPFRTSIKLYMKRAREIESYLALKPNEWGKFQEEFNTEINGVFRSIMNFEKTNLANGHEDKVYKLKQLFINKFREIFARGVYCEWSIRKPFGYAGDYKIIEDIYENKPTTTGFERLFDNYYQMSAISIAVRNRKEDFKKLITDFVISRQGEALKIMNLGSGPCREIREMLCSNKTLYENVIFDCIDNDERAIQYAKNILSGFRNVNLIKENAIRIALRKNINSMTRKNYDFIYATGIFDYFGDRLATALVRSLGKLMKPNGVMAIASVRDKYSNPSVHFMEWAGDWNLIYRDDENFKNIFIEAGFKEKNLNIQYEQQGIMQYIIAFNKPG